jgi:predicted PurR-regulated permease PerM
MVKSLGRVGFSRQAATIVILSGFLIILGVFLAITVPVLYREISELANDLPGLFERLSNMAAPYQNRFQELVGQDGSNPIALLKEQAGNSLAAGKTILSGLKAGGAAITSFFTVIIVMPIVAYFMMEEWPRLLNWVEGLMPRPHKDTIMDLLGEMDKKVAGFVRGQISVAAMLGIMYAIGLSLAGLNYGFLIGFFAGIFCIIPMVGSTLGLFVGILVAWLQTGELSYVALIGGIFIAGQIIEGNFLTPKIVGDKVGLHPLWVFFALMAGGALFGVVGMLIAVPVAAVIRVKVGFLI